MVMINMVFLMSFHTRIKLYKLAELDFLNTIIILSLRGRADVVALLVN